MGVKGLWTVVSNCGRPTALETLEQKVLSIDISIWLYQAVHGMKGFGGSSVANSHLLILFHRICKLLFYKIKPVFVFDGGVPQLKKQTLAARRLKKDAAKNKAQKIRDRLLNNLLKSQAVRNALGVKGRAPSNYVVPKVENHQKDLFELPPLAEEALMPTNLQEGKEDITPFCNIHDFTPEESSFKSLPLQRQHEIMCDLKDTRKENSWGSINEMPQEVANFAEYQMSRLLKRKQFQETLETIQSKIQVDQTKELEAKLFGELEDHVSLSHRIVSEDGHSILAKKQKVKEPSPCLPITETQAKPTPIAQSSVDFLTEFSKHGLISENLPQQQETNTLSSDEEELSETEKERLEQMSFLKAVDVVLDENEFSQEEILKLIEKSKCEVEKQSHISFDPNKPSTSKCFPCENVAEETMLSSSSDDDDDMVEVPMEAVEQEEMPLTSSQGTNLEAIKKAKTQSLYLKIIQQQIEENEKSQSLQSPSKKAPVKSVPISFNVKSASKSDIFSDVFGSVSPDNKILPSKNPASSFQDTIADNLEKPVVSNVVEEDVKEKVDRLLKIEIEKALAKINNKQSSSSTRHAAIGGEKFYSEASTSLGEPNLVKEKIASTQSLEEAVNLNTQVEPKSSSSTKKEDTLAHESIESPIKYSDKELSNLEANLMSEQDLLIAEMSKMDRQASSIGDHKYREAQELLQLFGIPYVVAPMEAEAQCAFLEGIGLTHGTITDDSDVFLFGGKSVYRNFFNNNKHVELFTAQNLEGTYGLTRSRLIQLALLTGSDYTVGIESVGAVMAMEVISEFPGDEITGLEDLKTWWCHHRNNPVASSGSKIKQRVRQLYIPESFPSRTIYDAYINPEVDKSSEKFGWNVPNVQLLTKFAGEKFGWNPSKCSEILTPVIKKLGIASSQTRIDNYFTKISLVKEPKHSSKRLREAVAKSRGDPLPEVSQPTSKKMKRTIEITTKKTKKEPSKKIKSKIDSETSSSSLTKEQKKEEQFRKLFEPEKNLLSEREALEKEKRRQKALSILRKQLKNKS